MPVFAPSADGAYYPGENFLFSVCRPTSLQNVSISVPVDGVVTDMVSQPKGVWLDDTRRAIWRFSDVDGIGSIR